MSGHVDAGRGCPPGVSDQLDLEVLREIVHGPLRDRSDDGFTVLRVGQVRAILAALERIPELEGEVRRLGSWDGLMSVLDEHYPSETFGGSSGEASDSGVRIVVLARVIDTYRARCEAAAVELDSLRARYERQMGQLQRAQRVEAAASALLADLKAEYGWDDGTDLEVALTGAGPAATCLDCNMEVSLKADGQPLAVDRCPICGSWLCTCPDAGDDGHRLDCPLGKSLAAAAREPGRG